MVVELRYPPLDVVIRNRFWRHNNHLIGKKIIIAVIYSISLHCNHRGHEIITIEFDLNGVRDVELNRRPVDVTIVDEPSIVISQKNISILTIAVINCNWLFHVGRDSIKKLSRFKCTHGNSPKKSMKDKIESAARRSQPHSHRSDVGRRGRQQLLLSSRSIFATFFLEWESSTTFLIQTVSQSLKFISLF